ncbi:hypothetical protein HDU67_007492 [Dinochytrium kinnereticum]|nr:hypothetical protein HDU67_007492 [Dinochytrium kinnereticum]
MGKPHTQKVKMLASAIGGGSKAHLAATERFGGLPFDMLQHRAILPTFLHGKTLTTTERLTEKGSNRIKRVVFPNIIYRFVYSRLLDMNIYSRLSTTTLRQIERRGGFDEYLLTVGEGKCDNEPAKMYKKMVEKAFAKERDQIRQEELSLAAKYGEDYVKQITQFHRRLDRYKEGSVSRL